MKFIVNKNPQKVKLDLYTALKPHYLNLQMQTRFNKNQNVLCTPKEYFARECFQCENFFSQQDTCFLEKKANHPLLIYIYIYI
jgi:hypothetical protein